MDTTDVSRLSPQDAIVSLRSLPRRFRTALRPVDDDNLDEFAQRVGAGGESPLDHLVDAARTLALIQQGLQQVLRSDDSVLAPATFDAAARDWPAGGADLDGELGHLDESATSLAEAAERVSAKDWGRTARVAGGGAEVTALDLLREAVRTAIADLRAAEAVLDEVRR